MSAENKSLVARLPLEVFGQGKVEVVDEVLAPDFIDHNTPIPGLPPGREGVKVFAVVVRTAFPDLHITLNRAVAEDDLVVLHITSSATMEGEFAGMPPSGKRATWDAIHIERVNNGRIVEHWTVQDQLGMLQQLGLIPMPGAARAAG